MKKERILLTITATTFALTLGIGISMSGSPLPKINASGEGPIYSLNLNNKKIYSSTTPYIEEVESSFNTINNNEIKIKASNVINDESGWQTLLPNGYLYNPLLNVTNRNKISGIKSIVFSSEDSKNLTLTYGYEINGNQIIYSHEDILSPNVSYIFNDFNPNYFYVKNNNDSNVNITNLTITYTCSDTGYPNQNLNVLMIGNSFADDTLFYSARIAQSYGVTISLFDVYIRGCTSDQHDKKLNIQCVL